MPICTVVNLYKSPYDVYIGRAGKGKDGYWGNPYDLLSYTREESLQFFQEYFFQRIEEDPEFAKRLHDLRGKSLGCFCSPKPCHGHIIAEYVNSLGE